MKKTHALILAASLVASSGAFAASGATPTCTNGEVNLVIYNKDLDSGNCFSSKGAGRYCIGGDIYTCIPGYETCEDDDSVELLKNTNESYSISGLEGEATIRNLVHIKGSDGKRHPKHFTVTYAGGTITNNCNQVFGSDVKCEVTQSKTKNGHPIYTVTISKNS